MNALKFVDIMLPNSMFKCHIPMTRVVTDEFVSEDFPYGRGVIPHLNIPLTYEEVTSKGNLIYDTALELIRDGIYLEEASEDETENTCNTARWIYLSIGLLILVGLASLLYRKRSRK